MFTDWAAIESAAAWELAAEAAEFELGPARWVFGKLDAWGLIEQRAGAELAGVTVTRFCGRLDPHSAVRAPGAQREQLGLFEAAGSPQVSVALAIDEFNGPCVVCGEPGRRRNTMPAAIAAIMPPLEPTCRGHELVCDWGIPLSADQVDRMLSGELPGVPAFRYRTVRGSKAATEAKAVRAKASRKEVEHGLG